MFFEVATLASDAAMSVKTELPDLLYTSAVSVASIQALKNSKLPALSFVNQHSNRVNQTISVLFATVSSIGLHYKFDPNAGTLLISGLTLATLVPAALHAGSDTAKSWAFNWILYQLVKTRAADVAAVQEGIPSGKATIPVASPGVIAAAHEDGPAKALVKKKRKRKTVKRK